MFNSQLGQVNHLIDSNSHFTVGKRELLNAQTLKPHLAHEKPQRLYSRLICSSLIWQMRNLKDLDIPVSFGKAEILKTHVYISHLTAENS